MTRSGIVVTFAVLSAFSLMSCSTITTHAVSKSELGSPPKGVRVYAPKIYLFVDKEQHKSTIANLPDYNRVYDVKPLTILSKQDFNIKMDIGQVSELTSNQDTTALLSFVKEAAQMAVKAGCLPAALQTIDGDFGLDSGIYTLTDDGTWMKIPYLR